MARIVAMTSGSHPEQNRADLFASLRRREEFLSTCSRILAESLDYQRTLDAVARLAVPDIADSCRIDLLDEAGTLVPAAAEHRDPRVAQLEVRSTIRTPLSAHGRILGTLTLSTAGERQLTPDDVRLAEAVAERAAFAIHHARVYEQAQRALDARQEVLAIVTHDLRAPLSAVLAGASLLSTVDAETLDPERIRKRGDTIRRAAQHMLRLVNDLTDLAHIDAGRLAVQKGPADPASLVADLLEALSPVARERGATLRAEVGADLPQVSMDRDRIRQVLANLVGNAAKVGATEIVVTVTPRPGELVFSVADNGPGIPAHDLPRMFDRYFRRRDTEYKGSGLGLAICHGIVTAHGGRMWIESTVGTGSTFFFSIPAQDAAREPD